MKKDYYGQSITEACETEITEEFVKNLKVLSPEICVRRLAAIMNQNNNLSFVDLASRFNSVAHVNTSVD